MMTGLESEHTPVMESYVVHSGSLKQLVALPLYTLHKESAAAHSVLFLTLREQIGHSASLARAAMSKKSLAQNKAMHVLFGY